MLKSMNSFFKYFIYCLFYFFYFCCYFWHLAISLPLTFAEHMVLPLLTNSAMRWARNASKSPSDMITLQFNILNLLYLLKSM